MLRIGILRRHICKKEEKKKMKRNIKIEQKLKLKISFFLGWLEYFFISRRGFYRFYHLLDVLRYGELV